MLDENAAAPDAPVAVVDDHAPLAPDPDVAPVGAHVADGEPADATVAPVGRRRRVSKWDRPKDPHDWRWVVAGIGRVLISTGILMFGFVAYQLWGTALQTAAAQNELENEFEDQIAALPTLPM